MGRPGYDGEKRPSFHQTLPQPEKTYEMNRHDFQDVEVEPASIFKSFHVLDYPNDYSIEEFVKGIALASNRGSEKAIEWIKKLNSQDIDTVGDLRALHEEDWASL